MRVVALAGGVGGAKLAEGLSAILGQDLTVIVNTGDDFVHYGLNISPDLDTVCYTLGGLANPDTGWGRKDESWTTFENLQKLNGVDWFRLGDADLATHLERTRRLRLGDSLSVITREFCAAWSVKSTVLPMSDQPVGTMICTKAGEMLSFQEYFVHQRCMPEFNNMILSGIENATPAPGVLEAIEAADRIVFCPSNPWVSITPILSVKGIRAAIQRKQKVIAVSPIISGKTVKGPAAKMFMEMGIQPSSFAVAAFYQNVIKGLVIDHADTHEGDAIKQCGIMSFGTDIMMNSVPDRKRLALEVLDFSQIL